MSNVAFYLTAPAEGVSNDKSSFVSQELSKSDRPDLNSASIVISGGEWTHDTNTVLLPTWRTQAGYEMRS